MWHICQFQCFGKQYQLFPQIKSWASGNRMCWCKTIMKFCSRKFRISRLLQLYTSREGLGTAKLFVGVSRNDVTVNNFFRSETFPFIYIYLQTDPTNLWLHFLVSHQFHRWLLGGLWDQRWPFPPTSTLWWLGQLHSMMWWVDCHFPNVQGRFLTNMSGYFWLKV